MLSWSMFLKSCVGYVNLKGKKDRKTGSQMWSRGRREVDQAGWDPVADQKAQWEAQGWLII